MIKRRATTIFLVVLTGALLVVCYVIAQPFLRPIISATVIVIVFFPIHARIARVIRNPSLAALISTILVIVIFVLPAVLIGIAVARELRSLYDLLSEESSHSGGWAAYALSLIERPLSWIGSHLDVQEINLRDELTRRLREASQSLLGQGAQVVRNVATFVVNSVITLFILFFLFREGRSVRRRLAAVLPLNAEQTERLFNRINDAIIATLYGGLAVGLAQGSLTSLTFVILGLPSPIMWGLVTAMFSLVPMIGSAAVWVPASIILLLTGNWVKGLILAGVGAGVISTIDNIIRPYIIGERVQLHTLLVFFAVLGGIRAFGVIGLFIGPVTLAVTIALLGMLREEGKAWQASWGAQQPSAPDG